MDYRKEALMRKSSYQDGGVEGLAQKRAQMQGTLDRDLLQMKGITEARKQNGGGEVPIQQYADMQKGISSSDAITDFHAPKPLGRDITDEQSSDLQNQKILNSMRKGIDAEQGSRNPASTYESSIEPNEQEALESIHGKKKSEWGNAEWKQYLDNKNKTGGAV